MLGGDEGIAALSLSYTLQQLGLPKRCRHERKTCESTLITHTVGGCTRASAVGTLPQNTCAELIPGKKTVAAQLNNTEKIETVTA